MNNITYNFDESLHVVCCRITGRFPETDADIEKIYETLASMLEKHNTGNIMLDYRLLEYNQPAYQIIRVPERTVKYGMNSKSVRIAHVFDKSSNTFRHYQLVFAEAETKKYLGILKTKFAVFDCLDEAGQWLTGNF